MKTLALVASVLLHVGALSAVPTKDAHQSEAKIAATTLRASDSCKCDLEITADCSKAEAR